MINRLPENRFCRQWIRIENFWDFRHQRLKRICCSAKGTDEQHWTVCNRPSRIGVKSGSADQREEARGISQVNTGLLFPRIRNRGQRIEDLESASETTSWISATAKKKQRDKEEAASKEHSTPPTRESWPKWIRSLLHSIDSQMPDPIRLYLNLDTHSRPQSTFGTTISSMTRRSCAQACRACAYAPAARNGDLSFGSSARIAEEVPDWTFRIRKQWISKEPTQSLPGNGSTMDD